MDLQTIRDAVIGEGTTIETVFGERPLIYADYVASGRSLSFIEDFITGSVLPYYANTHSESSFTGRQTTHLREQAREEIRNAIGAGEDHAIIFCGSGATAAVDKLIGILNLRIPAELDERFSLSAQIPEEQRPVVFIGPYEHHSNELPWRESIATLVSIPLCPDGLLDLATLERELETYADRPLKIGSFSAASNVTGIKTNINAVTRLLHRYGALSFYDYAAAAPYVQINMSGNGMAESGPDAVFLSPHKFIGGPGTPGVLAIRKNIINSVVPAVPGGGTVKFVTPHDHVYEEDIERREEGGTPAIVESIRAGLVFRVQREVGTDVIREREEDFIRRAIHRWSDHPRIDILGNKEADRLSILSLRICWQDKELHYGFIVSLLNDLFGIQARGGCSCAGPYGHTLLGLSDIYSEELSARVLEGNTVLRPGWTRLSFNYFIDEETFEYILSAIELIADHGWRLLPYYHYEDSSGTWLYQRRRPSLPIGLESMTALGEEIAATPRSFELEKLLTEAIGEMTRPRGNTNTFCLDLPPEAADLAWFVLPQETAAALASEAA